MQYGEIITQEPQRENNAADYIILDREIVNVFISSCTFFCFCTFLTFFEKDLFSLTFLHRRLEQQNMTRHQLMHPESNESLLILLRRLATWRYPHLLLSAQRDSGYTLISPTRKALSSKPTSRHCCYRSMRQTDARPLHRACVGGDNEHVIANILS